MSSESTRLARSPIAIVGVGCRFPGGARSAESLWQLLADGTDATTEVPPGRWDARRFYDPDPSKPGKMYINRGGFLREAIDRFDAEFFDISPREAACMDPQQRLLLEIAWEALEDAGIPAASLSQSPVGVFVGGFCTDALIGNLGPLNRKLINSFTAVSATLTILANRISYAFNFRGPSMSIDTACSASLVALHVACRSIWAGDCKMALVGGVNLMLRPEFPITMCKGHFLSPDGRCKSFDARADGYGRGEGAGIVVLKPLSEALRDEDRIYAVVRATGANQDGRTDGITVPSQAAQEALVRQVCLEAAVEPHAIRYVETHGTGTPVGDPIEANALGSVLGQGRENANACVIGSIKANIGHLEAASGVAGLIKAALVLKHKQVPPQRLESPNPKIPFEKLGLRFAKSLEPLPDGEGPAYASINSFGYGGTNAHALLEEAPPEKVSESASQGRGQERNWLLPISARSAGALRELAESYLDLLQQEVPPCLVDLCFSASVRRDHHKYRICFAGASHSALAMKLRGFLEDGRGVKTASRDIGRGLVFVYTGMGPQWWAMGRELLAREPIFRQTAEACDRVFKRLSGWSILTEMEATEERSRMLETQVAQPANFVVQAGLTELWASWGIKPDAVVGHSVGEVAAAYASQALSLEDAVCVSFHRSRLQQRAAGLGKMLAVGLSEAEARRLLKTCEDKVSIAAVNSHNSVTLAGDPRALEQIAKEVDALGAFNRMLQVEVAYHSSHMDPLEKDLLSSLAGIRPQRPMIPMYSTVTGVLSEEDLLDAEYWFRNVRKPVQFAASMDTLLLDGYRLFVETGPHPVLSTSIKDAFARNRVQGLLFSTLRRPNPSQPINFEPHLMSEALASLHCAGFPVDWRAYYAGNPVRYIPLPRYPWQRETYSQESEDALSDRLGTNAHPLLERKIRMPGFAWESSLSSGNVPYLEDHLVNDDIVFPGAGYVEACLAAVQSAMDRDACVLEDIEFHRMLFVPKGSEPALSIRFDEQLRRFTIFGRVREESRDWTLHATARLTDLRNKPHAQGSLVDARARCQTQMETAELYDILEARGLRYGSTFQTVQEVWRGPNESLARVQIDSSLLQDRFQAYRLHPTLLDGCFQALLGALNKDAEIGNAVFVPVRIAQVRLNRRVGETVWSHARVISKSEESVEGELALYDADGGLVAEVVGIQCRSISRNRKVSTKIDDLLYSVSWCPSELPTPLSAEAPGAWLIVECEEGSGAVLEKHLARTGARCIRKPLLTISANEFRSLAPFRGVIYLNGREAASLSNDALGSACMNKWLSFLQSFAAEAASAPHPRLYLVTWDAQPVNETPVRLAQVPMVGLARVAANEFPHLGVVSLDASGAEDFESAMQALAKELLSGSAEREVAFRKGIRYARRLDRTGSERETAQPNGTPFQLECEVSGVLDSLSCRSVSRRMPGSGEVELEIHAAALNYKDVLKAMGNIPDKALENTLFGREMGMDASGRVVRVGPDVSGLKVGDEVAGAIPGCFRNFVTLPAERIFLWKKLERYSHEINASLPMIFVTAYHALHEVARVRRGESVLIHGAAGGVGLASIQLAKHYGVNVYATAGSPEKREYLRLLGVSHAMDSRSLDFVEEILDHTKGRGVDVVLNSVSGEVLQKSLALLAPFGRFIELGKRDIVENAAIPMLPFNRNLTFAAIDLDRAMIEDAPRVRTAAQEVWAMFQSGVLSPVPVESFPVADAANAFHKMASSKHIGKLVLSIKEQAPALLPPKAGDRPLFRPDASYLVTGGFGGFGLELARWMSREGARYLVLVGRRGASSPQAKKALETLRGEGVNVMDAAADIGDPVQVRTLLDRIAREHPPLRGIMHTAMVLDDGALAQMTPQRLEKVLQPKAAGAWHLHRETKSLALDCFVLFSSISSLIGNPGQGNYVAANAFLDALAHERQSHGLCGISINWGVLADVGVAARDTKVLDHLERMGLRAIKPADALAALGRMLRMGAAQAGAFDIDWKRWSQANPAMAESAFFENLVTKHDRFAPAVTEDPVVALQTAKPEQRPDLARTMLVDRVAQITLMPPDRVDVERPLSNMGIDSLILVELQMAIEKDFRVQFSPQDLAKANLLEVTKRLVAAIA